MIASIIQENTKKANWWLCHTEISRLVEEIDIFWLIVRSSGRRFGPEFVK
jgi:hypothetical protein